MLTKIRVYIKKKQQVLLHMHEPKELKFNIISKCLLQYPQAITANRISIKGRQVLRYLVIHIRQNTYLTHFSSL